MKKLFITLLAIFIAACGTEKSNASEPVRKNVVIIYADDLGWGQVGFNGQKHIITPNLDKYATQGIKLDNFYSSAPFCPPARNSLMVGMDTAETVWRVNDMVFGREPTMAQMFKAYGYDTSMYGKWGMSVPKLSPAESHNYKLTCSNMEQFYSTLSYEFEQAGDPIDAGFDSFVGFMDHRDAHVYYHDSPDYQSQSTPEHPYNANAIRQDLFTIKNGEINRYPTTMDQYLPDVIIQDAMNHLDEVAKNGKPFFMYLPSQLPHAELVDPPNMEMLYTDENGKSLFTEQPFYGDSIYYRHAKTPRATLARMITRLDTHVGWVVDKLKQLGLYDNTIIIFTSDNGHHTAGGIGDYDFFGANEKIRGHKWELFEGGIRVPAIIFGGGIKPAVIKSRYAQYQIKDTFQEMLSGSKARYSFYPVLLGNHAEQLDYLYFQFLHEQSTYSASPTVQAVIKGNYKMIRFNKQSPYYMLFDLSESDYEANNRMRENCDVSKELVEYLNSKLDPQFEKGSISCN